MITSQDFKNYYFETIFNVAKNTFLPLLLVMTILYAILIVLVALVLLFSLGIDFSFVQEFMSLGMFERNELIENLIQNSVFNSFDPANFDYSMIMTIIGVGVCIFLVFLLFMSWYYNFNFVLVDDYIKNKLNLKESFLNSFSKKVFTIFFMMILSFFFVLVVEILIFAFVGVLASLHFSLGFIGGFVGVIFMITLFFRFILVLPHIINTEDSSIESLSYSFRAVSFKSALKYFAILFVAYIVFIIISLLVMSFKILGGVYGLVVLSILQVFFTSFITAFAISANLGLYYVYRPECIDKGMELEKGENLNKLENDLELLMD